MSLSQNGSCSMIFCHVACVSVILRWVPLCENDSFSIMFCHFAGPSTVALGSHIFNIYSFVGAQAQISDLANNMISNRSAGSSMPIGNHIPERLRWEIIFLIYIYIYIFEFWSPGSNFRPSEQNMISNRSAGSSMPIGDQIFR